MYGCSDLTEATLAGASITIATAIVVMLLFTAELSAYMKTQTKTDLVIDRSLHGELLRVNFNISFTSLSCEFATLDVSDALGTKKLNLTKTVRKIPIDNKSLSRVGKAQIDKIRAEPQYDEEEDHPGEKYDDADFATPLTSQTWDDHMKRYDIVVVNFYAPWCPWCQRLGPTWEAVTEKVHQKYSDDDARIRFAKVDCTTQADLCKKNQITAYPSIRVFHDGSDDVVKYGQHEHLSYHGNRTQESLLSFADELAQAAGGSHAKDRRRNLRNHKDLEVFSTAGSGCQFTGFVLVKKVPGTLHFAARAPGHSIDFLNIDMSHIVHSFYFGILPSPRRRKALASLHPLGLSDDWADSMKGQEFISTAIGSTTEHYLQVVLTSIEPRASPETRFDAYEYTSQVCYCIG